MAPAQTTLPRTRKPARLRVRAKGVLQRLLDRVETMCSSGDIAKPLAHAPIFIVGAPRSGSTLLYQLLTDCYDVGYISNVHCRWHGGPSLVERLRRPLRGRDGSDFTSDHGATARPTDPSECGEYWYRFFPRRPHHVGFDELAPRQLRRLRASMRALVGAFDRPVVLKNLYCTLRMEPIAAALPESLFVAIHRDEVDNAHSLLQGRRSVVGDYATWWSAEPVDVDKLRLLPVHEQVVEQVRSIERSVDAARQRLGADRFFDVSYESLCADPAGTLGAYERFLAGHGVELRQRRPAPPPFDRVARVTIDRALYDDMRAYAVGEAVQADA